METREMATLHIIENYRDSQLATQLADRLRSRDYAVTRYIEFLVPGEEWKSSLRKAVAGAHGLIAVLSENSVQPSLDAPVPFRATGPTSTAISSQWMAADIGAARASGKFVIPVIVGDEVGIPPLIDDMFVVRVKSASEIDLSVSKIDEAIQVHMKRRALQLPSGYEHLAPSVLRLRKDSPYDRSVFVMMKFPDSALRAEHRQLLTEIWEVLSRVLFSHDLIAQRADKKSYHDQLWENICVYMLGSRYGIAILEDRVAQELNPNVALESGFMKAINRQVALFRDVQFGHDRADLTGKLAQTFVIDKSGQLDQETLRTAVRDWLLDIGVAPVRRL